MVISVIKTLLLAFAGSALIGVLSQVLLVGTLGINGAGMIGMVLAGLWGYFVSKRFPLTGN